MMMWIGLLMMVAGLIVGFVALTRTIKPKDTP